MFIEAIFNVGDEIQLVPEATFVKGRQIPAEYFGEKFVVRAIQADSYEIGRSLTGYPVGVIAKNFVIPYNAIPVAAADFEPYFVSIVKDTATVRLAPMPSAKEIAILEKFAFFRIIAEKDGFAKLDNHPGWVSLTDVKVIKNG